MPEKPLDLEKLADEIIRVEYPTYEQAPPGLREAIIRKKQQIKQILERHIEKDLTEHIYKPLAKGIGISTALLGILLAVSSSILAIPVFIISYLCFRGLWKWRNRWKQ